MSATAQAVKTKLSRKEQTVVRPMRMGPGDDGRSRSRRSKKAANSTKQRFTIVQEEETSDQFDLGSTSTEESTAEDEYREDPVTAVRLNVHGKRIKQPMALPTFEDEEESQSESGRSAEDEAERVRRKKRARKKRKKEERRKAEEVEAQRADGRHLNVMINNENNMGFGSEELLDDDLTKEEVAMTMNDLQMELGKHAAAESVAPTLDGDGPDTVDLSFLDIAAGGGGGGDDVHKNEMAGNSDMDISNGNGVAGNGIDVPHE